MVERRRRRLRRGNGTGLRSAAEVASEQAGLSQGTGQQATPRTGVNLRSAGEVAGEQAAARAARLRRQRNAPLGPYEQALNVGEAQLESAVPATKGAVAGAFGYEDYAREQAEEATRIQREAAAEGPPIMQASDVEGIGDVPQYLGQTILSQGPNIAATTAGAVAGGGVAGLARRGLRRGAREAAQEGGEAAARQGLARSTQAGAFAGTGAAETAQITAETFPRLMNDAEAREDFSITDLSRRALGTSAASGAIGMAPAFNVMRRLGLSGAGRQLERGLSRRVAGGAGTQAGTEAVTETVQQALMRGVHSTVNENIGVFDDEGLQELLNAAAAGGVVGGATGAAAGLPGGGRARRERRRGLLGRGRERRRAAREAAETAETAARTQYNRMQEVAPETVDDLAGEDGEVDFSDPETQQRVKDARIRYARSVDPREEAEFTPQMSAAADSLISSFANEAIALRNRTDELVNSPSEAEDALTRQEEEDTRSRAAGDLDAELGRVEGVIDRLSRARDQGDAEAFINQTLDALIDQDVTMTDEVVGSLRQAFEPFQAQFTDLYNLRLEERGENATEGIDGLDMSDLAGDDPDANPFASLSEDEALTPSESTDEAEGPGLTEVDAGEVTYIGQEKRGGRLNPYVSRQATQRVSNEDFSDESGKMSGAERWIQRQRERYGRTDADDPPNSVTTPEGHFQVVPFREVVAADYRNERERYSSEEEFPERTVRTEDTDTVADMEERLAAGQRDGSLSEEEQAQLIERIDQTARTTTNQSTETLEEFLARRGREIGEDARRNKPNGAIAQAYDPDNPTRVLDELEVIRKTDMPPQFGQGDPTALTDADLDRATHRIRWDKKNNPREQLRRKQDGTLPRGAIAVQEDGQERIYDLMELARNIQDRLPDREGAKAGSTQRAAEVVWEALSSLANQPGKRVNLQPEQIDPDTRAFRVQGRDVTWGEILAAPESARRLQEQVASLETRLDNTTDRDEQQHLRGQLKGARSLLGRRRRQENQEQTQADIDARRVLAEPDKYTERDVAEARAYLDDRARQRAAELERSFRERQEDAPDASALDVTASAQANLERLREQRKLINDQLRDEDSQEVRDARDELDREITAVEASIREQEQAAANVDAEPGDQSEQPVNASVRRRPQPGDSPAGTDEDTRPRLNRAPGDQEYTEIGRDEHQLGKAERALNLLRTAKGTRHARRIFEEQIGRETRNPDDINAMIEEAAAERDRVQQRLWDYAVADRQLHMEQALADTTVDDARRLFRQLFGEPLPNRATIAEIRERVANASELRRQARAPREQLVSEQSILRAWAERLDIDIDNERLRVVDRDEIAPLLTDRELARLDSGRAHAITHTDDGGNYRVYVRDGLTREARIEHLAHEMGHIVYREHADRLTETEAGHMWEAFNKWRTARGKPRADLRGALTSKQAVATATENLSKLRGYTYMENLSPEQREYILDFEEWFADNTARWLTQTKEPRSIVERFFKRVADSLKALFNQARKPRNEGGQNLSYRAEKNVAGFLRRMWMKTPREVYGETEVRQAAEQAYEDMPLPDGVVHEVSEEVVLEGTPEDEAYVRRVINAAHAQATDPHDTGTSYTMKGVFDLLTSEERAALGREFMRPEVRRQLEKLIGDMGVMASIDHGNVRSAMSYGYQFWMDGQLTLTPRSHSLFQKLYQKLSDVFGIVTQHEQAQQVLEAINNGTVAARNAAEPITGDGVVKRFRMENRLQETAAKAVEGFDLAMKPIRWGWGAQSRIMAEDNPVFDALTQEFQPRPGTERNPQGMYEARMAARGRFHAGFFRATQDLSAEQGEALLELLQGNPMENMPSEGTPVRAAYDAVRKQLDDMRKYAVSRGVNMGYIENYFPWVFDTETLERHHAEFINLLSQEKFNDDLQRTEASLDGEAESDTIRRLSSDERVAIAERIYDALMKHDGYADTDMRVQDGNNIPALTAAHQRKLNWIWEQGDDQDRTQLTGFFKKDLGETLAAYTEQIIKRAEWTSRFGNQGEVLQRQFDEARQFGASEADIELMKKYVNSMMGTHGRELAPLLQQIATTTGKWFGQDWSNLNPDRFRKLQGVMMVYQNIRVLGLATLTSIADTGGIIVRSNDLGTAMEAFRQGLKEITLGIRMRTTGRGRPEAEFQSEMRRLAETMGTIDVHMVNEVLGESYGGLYLTGRTRRWNEKFFKVIQLQRWTQFSRIMSLAAGKTFLLKHRDGAYSEHSERFLQQLNLKPEDIRVDDETGDLVILSDAERQEIVAQRRELREQLTAAEEAGNTGDAAALRIEIDDLRAELLRDGRIRTALNRYVDESVMRPNPAQRPIWASHPDAQLLFHLKQFAYAIHNQITRRILTEAGQGNYWPMLAATSYIPIMIAADLLREDIQYGEDGDPRKRHWDAWDYVKDGIHRSGMTGLGTFLLDAHKDRTQFGGVGYESLQGPTITQMRDIGDYLINGNGEGLSVMADAMPANSLWSNWDFDMTQVEEAPADLQRNTIGSWRN